jgi:hypothetical protein
LAGGRLRVRGILRSLGYLRHHSVGVGTAEPGEDKGSAKQQEKNGCHPGHRQRRDRGKWSPSRLPSAGDRCSHCRRATQHRPQRLQRPSRFGPHLGAGGQHVAQRTLLGKLVAEAGERGGADRAAIAMRLQSSGRFPRGQSGEQRSGIGTARRDRHPVH